MYTQCSKCETVFRLSAEALRAAGGQVRCGRCGEVFNALARLAEEATAFPAGESSLESETRADAILHSVEPVATAAEPPQEGDEIAQLKVLDASGEESDDLDASLEFTLPPGELDRIFIETSPTPLQLLAASVKPSPAHGAPAPLVPAQAEPIQSGPKQTASMQTGPVPAASGPAASGPTASISAQGTATPGVPAPSESVHAARIPGLEVSEDIRQ